MIKSFFWCLWLIFLPFSLSAEEVQLPVVTKQFSIESDFNQPTSVATSTQGNIFVLDGMNSRVVVFSNTGKQLFIITPGQQIADFFQAVGITWSQGLLYIADTKNHRILVLTDKGTFVRYINLPVSIPERDLPTPIAVSVFEQTLIYTDRRFHRFCLIDLDQETFSQRCTGKRGEKEGEFQFPFQITVDETHYLHIVDVINGRVQIFNQRGKYFSQLGRFAVDELYRPNGIAIDNLGYEYISDAYLGTIAIFQQGHYLGVLTDENGQAVKFSSPSGLWYDSKGLYVIDSRENKLVILQLGYQRQKKIDLTLTQQSPDVSRKNCVACHFSWGFSDDKDLNDQQGIAPVASLSMCYSCHRGVVFESRQAIPHGGQHPTIYDANDKKLSRQKELPRDDDIPEQHPLLPNGEMLCTSCHTPHNSTDEQPTLYEENINSWMRLINNDADMCENCHESHVKTAKERSKKLRGINHPIGFKLSKPKKTKTKDYSDDPHLQKGLPLSLIKGGAMLGAKQQMTCQSCHQVHGGKGDDLLAVKKDQGTLCGECHKRQAPKGKKGARKAGVHPVNVKLEKPVKFRGKKVNRVDCQSCHSVHEGTQGTALYPDSIKETEKLCVACHKRHHAKNKEDAIKKGIHLMNEKLEKPVKIAGVEVKTMGCLSCHSIHNGKPNTPALLEDHKNGQLCENCHESKQRVVGTDHDFRVTAKKSENKFEESPHQAGVCGSCHTMHRGKAKQPYLYSATQAQKKHRDDSAPHLSVDELCMNCHQEKAIAKDKPIEYYGHPYKDIIMRSNQEVMPLLDKKTEKIENFGVIACITCHDPHRWAPKAPNEPKKYKVLNHKSQKNKEGNVLNSFLIRKGVQQTFCVSCHDIEALSKYKYFHHKDKARDIGADYLN